MNTDTINFPSDYHPSKCPVFVSNEITINAPKEDIWFWLTNITTWPDWYNNASNIQLLNQKDGHLNSHSKFKWRTFNTNIESTVQDFETHRSLAWDAHGLGLHAYHAWLIIPNDYGCKVITQETQKGWLSRLGKFFAPNQMYDQHQIWLEGLKRKAEHHRK